MTIIKRDWMPSWSQNYINRLEQSYSKLSNDGLEQEILKLIAKNNYIHNEQSINLNPATNIMNPKAERLLASGLGSRPSLGYPNDKYEMGLEAIEKIEIISSQLACEVFNCQYAEIRLGSGSLANLYAFMATTKPGDKIIVPAPEIAGHVSHHQAGVAGLYGLEIHYAAVDAVNYTIDLNALYEQVKKLRPKLITIGGSLNLFPHPVSEIRKIADEFGVYVHFDAAHLSGLFAGKVWPQPLEQGAHLMSFSTYKSLGGPASALLLTNDPILAERIDKIAYPGLTANFDVAKSAALAICLLDWKDYGKDYARAMLDSARALSNSLLEKGVDVFHKQGAATSSHQFAIKAEKYVDGQAAAKLLRRANILSSGIALPIKAVDNGLNGLRFGTPEIVRWGMQISDMPKIAEYVARVLVENEVPEKVAIDVSKFRKRFDKIHFIRK